MKAGDIVLVCGDRNWWDRDTIRERLSELPEGVIVVHGACRGADQLAGQEAKILGFEVREFPPNWSLGPSAGPIRNSQMIGMGPKLVLAFHNNIEKSRGTGDTVRKAMRKEIEVEVITSGRRKSGGK
jgi:hypothetical protein